MGLDIRRLDIYRKVPKDLTEPTRAGAVISICSTVFILYLLVSEIWLYVYPSMSSEIYVDDPAKFSRFVPVYINISLPKLNCQYVGLDIEDDLDRQEVGSFNQIQKFEIHDKTGCRVEGRFMISKAPGNFHISTHAFENVPENIDMSHIIHRFIIGTDTDNHDNGLKEKLDGIEKASFAPLNKVSRISVPSHATHNYLLRVVPTTYDESSVGRTFPFQFVELHNSKVSDKIPFILFQYDILPVTVRYFHRRAYFFHFLTNVCAIIGGTFTVAGIIDSMIFSASEIVKKIELGKLT